MTKEWWEDEYNPDSSETVDEETLDVNSGGITRRYELFIYEQYLYPKITEQERAILRPIAETLALLDGNAFFSMDIGDGREWYEQYLPEAYSLIIASGGFGGWISDCSWVKDLHHETDDIRQAYQNWRVLKFMKQ